jgi:hypothetical protein
MSNFISRKEECKMPVQWTGAITEWSYDKDRDPKYDTKKGPTIISIILSDSMANTDQPNVGIQLLAKYVLDSLGKSDKAQDFKDLLGDARKGRVSLTNLAKQPVAAPG